MTESLKCAVLAFVCADTLAAKRAILTQNPGLRSPVVCTVLCEQAEEELQRGNYSDSLAFLVNLAFILYANTERATAA